MALRRLERKIAALDGEITRYRMAESEYITMQQALNEWLKHHDSPKSPSALTELARRRAENYGIDTMPEKRKLPGLKLRLTISRAQLEALSANVQEHPTGSGGEALTVKAQQTRRKPKRKRVKRTYNAEPAPHVKPWDWGKHVRQLAHDQWAGWQGRVK